MLNTHFEGNNFYIVRGFMRNSLKLSGNALLIYAVIYGFNIHYKQPFFLPIKYIEEAVGVAKRSAIMILKDLVNKNFLIKNEFRDRTGYQRCNYSVNLDVIPEEFRTSLGAIETGLVQELHQGGCKNCTEPGAKNAHNNNIYNNNILERESAREAVSLDSSSLIAIIQHYNERCASTKQAPTSLQCIPPIVRSSLVERIKQVGVSEVLRVIDMATSNDNWCSTRPSCSLKFILDENNFSRIANGELTEIHNNNGNSTTSSRPEQRPTYEERQASFQQFIIDKLATGRALSDGEVPF